MNNERPAHKEKAMLHKVIFATTCNAILDTEPSYLKRSHREM